MVIPRLYHGGFYPFHRFPTGLSCFRLCRSICWVSSKCCSNSCSTAPKPCTSTWKSCFCWKKNGEPPEFLPWKNDETWEISGRYPILGGFATKSWGVGFSSMVYQQKWITEKTEDMS